MRYELLGGMHNESGKNYNRGDVFESKHNLIVMFPQKFKEVSGTVEATPAPPIPAPKKITPKKDEVPATEPETASVAAGMLLPTKNCWRWIVISWFRPRWEAPFTAVMLQP